jgi:hypothetical protein
MDWISLFHLIISFVINDERYNQDIEGATLYGAWRQSIGGNIQLDNNENMGNTTDIHSNIMDQLK